MTRLLSNRNFGRLTIASTGMALMIAWSLATVGCKKQSRDQSMILSQDLTTQNTKTDDLRQAMRYLKQMTPANTSKSAKEVQMGLNAWLRTADTGSLEFSPASLLSDLPADALEYVGCKNPSELAFNLWDVDYLYECQLAHAMSSWIVDFPVRDSLFAPLIASQSASLAAEDKVRLEEAYKLFDWTIRNIALENERSSDVSAMISDPRLPLSDDGPGYGYLPWETILFGRGDFIERGRVFSALARQRGIDTFWISIGAAPGASGKLFGVGMLLDNKIIVFEPKLGLPIVNPDTLHFATLKDIVENDRILRRLDLAGQFDYAYEASMMKSLQLLIDVPPCAASARMQLLESSLLGDERMNVFVALDELKEQLAAAAPQTSIHLWATPLLAQLQAATVRERLRDTTSFTLQYMSKHGVWLFPTPASAGRLKHLVGEFENTLDERGALATYMDSRIDNESIARLAYDPDVQKELQVTKQPSETKEQFEMRVQQAQFVFARAKLDVSLALGELHFDRGNYAAAEKWFNDRVIKDERAADLHPAAWYALARTYQEQGNLDAAEQALTQKATPQEAGNRLRLRYLKAKGS